VSDLSSKAAFLTWENS